MQPTQFLLHSTGSLSAGCVLTHWLIGGPIGGNPELHVTLYVTIWLFALVGYMCGRSSR